jgi:hypothetical protein
LTNARVRLTSRISHKRDMVLIALALTSTAHFATAQVTANSATLTNASLSLPDSPGFVNSSVSADEIASSSSNDTPDVPDAQTASPGTRSPRSTAGRYSMTIEPGQIAPPLRASDKFVMGFKENLTLFSVAGWALSAGYSQVTNDSPNYGTNSGAFAARFGAATARNVSENVFGDAILAPILREDPRYYRMGRGNGFFKRLVYSATRPLITKTDGGHTTPNFSSVGGNLLGSILTKAYYPRLNQSDTQIAETFGTSVGGTAIGDVVTEFYRDALELVHLKKRE